MKHLLYLDIDGVLANDETYGKRISTEWGVLYPFHEENVKLFNRLCLEFDIQYVISSTWRTQFSFDDLCSIFRWNGITQMPIGITGVCYAKRFSEHPLYPRVREIKENILQHKVEGVWFALDDMDLSDLNTEDEIHFIMSDPIEGLMGEGVYERIVHLINSK
jgi:hypothetical protein